MRIEKCYFCSCNIYPGHGNQFCRNDGQLFKFCRSKCYKAFKRKKNPRKTKWTKIYRMINRKELKTVTEKRMTEPLLLNNSLVSESITKIPQISEVVQKNTDSYIKDRILTEKEKKKEKELKYIEKHIHLSSEKVVEKEIKKRTKREAELN